MTNEPKLEQNSEIPIILKDTPKEKTSDKRVTIISIIISSALLWKYPLGREKQPGGKPPEQT